MTDEFYDITEIDVSTPEKIIKRAKHLENMTFRKVLELDINPNVDKSKYYNAKNKGGMGVLLNASLVMLQTVIEMPTSMKLELNLKQLALIEIRKVISGQESVLF